MSTEAAENAPAESLRTLAFTTHTKTGNGTWTQSATIATLKDGTDGSGEFVKRTPAQLDETYIDAYMTLVPMTANVTVASVRIKIRAFNDNVDEIADVQPWINGALRSDAMTMDTIGVSALVWDFLLDPTDGQPWTKARINSYSWGYRMHSGPHDTQSDQNTKLTDFLIEVYGAGRAITGAGSYVGGIISAGFNRQDFGNGSTRRR